MNGNWQNMMEALFDTRSWQQLEAESLKRMTLEYPYFPISQFMYAKKLKLDHHSAYSVQAAKTALFFNNPYWLNWQLNENAESLAQANAIHHSENGQEVAIQHHEPPATEPVEESHEIVVEPEPVSPEQFENGWEKAEEPLEELQDEVIELNNAFQVGDGSGLTEPTPQPEKEEEAAPQIEVEAPEIVNHPEPASEIGVQTETALSLEPKTNNEPLIPLEPLYATDYFASQGIKLSEVEESGDKLGKKLKSFTEWLKVMKRNRPMESELSGNNVQDQKIQRIAETSNQNREVLTETMAEVLLLQGLKEKAIEVYNKLSLLNPQKSAYFAAKIEEIKVN